VASIKLTLTSPNSSLNMRPISAEVSYTEMKHNYAALRVVRPTIGPISAFVSGMPLQLQWQGGPGRSGVFRGYVDKVDAPFVRTGTRMSQDLATIHCYGTTYWMKSEGYKTFVNMTADAIAAEIAAMYNLSIVVDPHPYVWPNMTIGGGSVFAFLTELAKRVGYTMYIKDTTIFFIDRRTAAGRQRIPFVYNLRKETHSLNDIIEFTPQMSSGDGLHEENAGLYTTIGVSKYSGNVFQITQQDTPRLGTTRIFPKLFSRTLPRRAPTSIAEAQSYIDAAEANSLFTMVADVMVRGNAGLWAGGLVDIHVQNLPNREYEGTWYILDAVHSISGSEYTTQMRIGTDATGTAFSTPKYSVLPKGEKKIPPTVYRAGAWQSQWRS
jgi:phage protein D